MNEELNGPRSEAGTGEVGGGVEVWGLGESFIEDVSYSR